MLTFLAAIFIYTLLDISQLKLEVYSDEQDSSSRSMSGRRISQFISVLMYLVLVVPLFYQRFQAEKFCLMNPEEKICYQHTSNCLIDQIPGSFYYDGYKDKFCSFVFPPGYSIYIESFHIDQPGPDNIVILESQDLDDTLGYHLKVEWANRLQKYWMKLPKSNPLSNKHIRRKNRQCVKTLNVKCFF